MVSVGKAERHGSCGVCQVSPLERLETRNIYWDVKAA